MTDIERHIAALRDPEWSVRINAAWALCRRIGPAAARRARNVANALLSAGELGVRPWVGYAGARPHNMPRAGVLV